MASGPGVGIVLRRGARKGRILIPFNQGPYGHWKVYVAYSDDSGETWRYGETVPEGGEGMGNEAQVVELADGSVMLNARSARGARCRKTAISKDGGDTWSYVSAPRQKDIGAKTMPGGAYDPTPGSRTMISAVGGWSKQRVCITHDDGRTWTVRRDMVDNYVFFAWHPQEVKVVYLGAAADGFRSDDRGQTWKRLGKPLRAVLRSNGDVVYAVSKLPNRRWQVERSTDRGETWRGLGAPVAHNIADIDVDPRDPDRVYATTYYGGVLIYDGRKWTARGEAEGLEKDFFGAMVFQRIAVDPVHPNVVYAGQNACWRGPA